MTKTKPDAIRGYYAVVTEPGPLATTLVGAGATVLQLRNKQASSAVLLEAARELVVAFPQVLVVVNDRVDVALAAGAGGVHLGQTDLPLAAAQRVRGARPLVIGVSTHDLEQVRAAVAGGADYLGYGPVFATSTKQDPDRVQGIEALGRAVAAAAPVPVVAIGGITPARAAEVAATGVAALCAIASVNAAADPAAAARALAAAARGQDAQPGNGRPPAAMRPE